MDSTRCSPYISVLQIREIDDVAQDMMMLVCSSDCVLMNKDLQCKDYVVVCVYSVCFFIRLHRSTKDSVNMFTVHGGFTIFARSLSSDRFTV